MSSISFGGHFTTPRLACALAVGAVTALLIATGAASASNAGAGGATVVRNPYGSPADCVVPDTTGDFWVFSCRIQQVIQPNGTVTEYVKGSLDPDFANVSSAAPSSARTDITTAQTGFSCDFVNGRFTAVVAGAVTPSGNVNMTCRSS